VLFKSPDAALRIPHLEFEIGADSKRRIDTVYNHITNAIWNLSAHLRGGIGGDGSGADSILETVDQLEALLDVAEPFDIVIDDPTGASMFKPTDGIEVIEL
jgi:C4-type Zn-finger protein